MTLTTGDVRKLLAEVKRIWQLYEIHDAGVTLWHKGLKRTDYTFEELREGLAWYLSGASRPPTPSDIMDATDEWRRMEGKRGSNVPGAGLPGDRAAHRGTRGAPT